MLSGAQRAIGCFRRCLRKSHPDRDQRFHARRTAPIVLVLDDALRAGEQIIDGEDRPAGAASDSTK